MGVALPVHHCAALYVATHSTVCTHAVLSRQQFKSAGICTSGTTLSAVHKFVCMPPVAVLSCLPPSAGGKLYSIQA